MLISSFLCVLECRDLLLFMRMTHSKLGRCASLPDGKYQKVIMILIDLRSFIILYSPSTSAARAAPD
jgi:hypothetical protein